MRAQTCGRLQRSCIGPIFKFWSKQGTIPVKNKHLCIPRDRLPSSFPIKVCINFVSPTRKLHSAFVTSQFIVLPQQKYANFVNNKARRMYCHYLPTYLQICHHLPTYFSDFNFRISFCISLTRDSFLFLTQKHHVLHPYKASDKFFLCKVKVKLSHYRPGQALGVPGG